MLQEWLNSQGRNPEPYTKFRTIDSTERSALSSEILEYLTKLVKVERFDPDFLEAMAEVLEWDGVRELIINPQMPELIRVKRGDFGEVLINGLLEEVFGYIIPIRKLRFKFIGNQTLPATDTVALKINGAIISEVCFVESKLRTSPDNSVAVEAYGQLREDYESKLPDILIFIAARLYETRHSLFTPFRSYMKERRDSTEKDTFCLSLCFDVECWDEDVLVKLQEKSSNLPRLTTQSIRINDLRNLTDDVFGRLGVGEISDED